MTLPKVIGTNDSITLTTGKKTRVVLLNNAATTPPFEKTLKEVNHFLQTYGALHRGAGPHANITFLKVQDALSSIRKFLNLPESHALLFTQNTSAAINLFARMLRLKKSDVVITSSIEHTSNNLAWHYNTEAQVVEVHAFEDGSIDYGDLEKKAAKHGKNLKLITMTGASNQTGYIPDIQKLSKIAHKHKALLFIDAAQLAPHRKMDMKQDGVDALAFSAHKVYAPFGIGVLALPKSLLDTIPADPGGGSIDMISEKDILWAPPQERHQTGTWNVTGIVACASSCKVLMDASWKAVEKHERELVEYMAERLPKVPNITMYVPSEKYLTENRIGTFPFNISGIHHAQLASILEHEYGIETRAGTICNHRLVRRWHKISDAEQKKIEKQIANGNRLASYGIVRASFAIHNTKKDIDLLLSALTEIAKNGPKLKYKAVPHEEIFIPINK
ncbi:MAG: aminotransferase class V-fold PLP-dependent enzyme [Patescibacteria group bacterium]